jgi:ribose 5-phosphate isomerase B
MRRLAVATDHAGVELAHALIALLPTLAPGWELVDLGGGTVGDDYPDAGRSVGEALYTGRAERGLVLCGSGIGVAIAANKLPGVRAAAIEEPELARLAVEDDDLNVLALGGRRLSTLEGAAILRAFLKTEFSGAARHVRRLEKLAAIEDES